MILKVFFDGRPGDARDELCREIIEQHGGKIVGAGTFLPTMSRDVEAEVPANKFSACFAALNDRGFKVERDHMEGTA